MKILKYSEVKPTHFESDEAKGVAAALWLVRKRAQVISVCGYLTTSGKKS